MRTLTAHQVGCVNEGLLVNVLDEPGHGGACHEYQIRRWVQNEGDGYDDAELCLIQFQNGPIKEAGVNGVTHEALLAVLIDRMQGFQAGDYSSRENAIALTKLQEAMHWLQHRTRERIARGVEGTHEK